MLAKCPYKRILASKLPECPYERILALKNQYRGPFLEQRKDKIPSLHGAMKVIELPSVKHA